MTDDKAIEAALDAWFGDWLRESDHLRERMRAALAAADKVRAPEGERKLSRFETRADAVGESARSWERVIEALDIGDTDDDPATKINEMVEYIATLRAGLAKGEAERAALVETLTWVREQRRMFAIPLSVIERIDATLALVRKGV